jgi:hypothetical protein
MLESVDVATRAPMPFGFHAIEAIITVKQKTHL